MRGMSYYESRSRARGNDEDEGLDYMTASGSTSSFPVFLQPAELHFIVSKPDTHKQVLTVYNPYEFGIRFTVLSNAPSRYRVVEPRGFIRPKCYVDIMIRHLSPTLAAMANNDCLRIEIFREGDATPCGRKDVVMSVLAADAKHNIDHDEFKAFPGPGTGAGTSRQISVRGQRQQVAFAGNSPPQFNVKLGQATSFFNEKNRNIAHDLAELIVEANQELPDWLEEIAKDTSRHGNRFGGRDHRVQYNGPPNRGFGGGGAFAHQNFYPAQSGPSSGSGWGPSSGGTNAPPPQKHHAQGAPGNASGGFVPSGGTVNRAQPATNTNAKNWWDN
ncbi:MSP (Major sperm protein) domain-containing protein [Ditylenchus destructor]|nr:MSP (Major sperm protein) domain-containing protein [Ditylenchus destructor]